MEQKIFRYNKGDRLSFDEPYIDFIEDNLSSMSDIEGHLKVNDNYRIIITIEKIKEKLDGKH